MTYHRSPFFVRDNNIIIHCNNSYIENHVHKACMSIDNAYLFLVSSTKCASLQS